MRALLSVALLVAACGQPQSETPVNETMEQRVARLQAHPLPPRQLIDDIEKRVASSPCVQSLGRWDRQYAYLLRGDEVDESVIEFVFVELKAPDRAPELRITSPGATIDPQDGRFQAVAGKFDRRTRAVTIDACGETGEMVP